MFDDSGFSKTSDALLSVLRKADAGSAASVAQNGLAPLSPAPPPVAPQGYGASTPPLGQTLPSGMTGQPRQQQPQMGQFGGQPQGQFNQPQAPMAQMGQFGGAMGGMMGGQPQMGQFGAPMEHASPAPAPAGPDPFAIFGGIQVTRSSIC